MMKTIINFLFFFFVLINPALAQSTAALLPQGKIQFLDNNGNPLSSGKVYFYIPSTTTFKTTWQDAGKTTPNTNPVILDAGGRAIIYGDGTYRQQVRASNNNLIFDAVTASAGTGGGTTGTGDGDLVGTIKPWAGLVAPNQYAFAYGQELSRTTYAALRTAITLNQNITCASGSPILTGLSDTSQLPVGAVIEATCIAAGSTVVSKTTTTVTMNNNASLNTATTAVFFPYGNGNGSTTFNVPDLRGNVVAGRTNMGGTASTNLTSTFFNGLLPNSVGAKGGLQFAQLQLANLPAYTPTGTVTAVAATGTVSTPTITVNNGTGIINNSAGTSFGGGVVGGSVNITATSSTPVFTGTGGTATFTGAAQGGTQQSFPLIQPTITLNYIIKITPDQNSASASGVTSLGLMTGDIACGAGLTCTGNIISTSGAGTGDVIGPFGATNNGFAVYDGTSGKLIKDHAATISLTTEVSGTLSAGNGGTGNTTYTIGDILQATGSTTLSKLAAVATGNALISGGVGAISSWGKVGLTTHVSGILPVANGGTNSSSASGTALDNITGFSSTGIMSRTGAGAYSFSTLTSLMDTGLCNTQGSVIYRNSTIWTCLAPGTSGQVLATNGIGANPQWNTVSGSGTVTSVALTMPAIFSVTGTPITGSGTFGVTATGTSGGIPYFDSSTTLASSSALVANRIVLGGGAGVAPSTPVGLGTTTTVLHGNAAGAPTFGAVSLTADVSGTLPVGNGGTNCSTASGTCLDNITGFASTGLISRTGAGTYSFSTLTSLFDSQFCGTQGAVLYRNSGTWVCLGVGSNGQVLTSGGAAANPSWTSVGGTGTVTSVTIAGTSNVIAVSGTCTITTSGTCAVDLATARKTLPTVQTLTSSSGTYTTAANVLWIEIYMVGGGGGAGGNGTASQTSGGAGGDTCWNTSGAACTSPVYRASGGSGGILPSAALGAPGSPGGLGGTISGGSGTPTWAINGTSGQNGGMSVNAAADGSGGNGGTTPCPWGGAGGIGGVSVGSGTAQSATNGLGFGAGGGGWNGSTGGRPGGGGGGSGACVYAIVNSPAASYTYANGAAGSAGGAGTGGNAGATGAAGRIIVVEHYGSSTQFICILILIFAPRRRRDADRIREPINL